MRDKREFHAILENIDGKPAQAYEALAGDFDFTRFVLHRLRVAAADAGGAGARDPRERTVGGDGQLIRPSHGADS